MNNYGLPHASTIAEDVDAAFMFITWANVIIFLGTTLVSVYFTWKYIQKKNTHVFTSPIDGNTKLEVIWTVIPIILLVVIFFWGLPSYFKGKIVPADAMEIKVTGKKWFWSFDYPNGSNSVNELVIPEGKPVKVLLSSTDVIHSLYIPAFRAKMDALPNRYTIMSFTPTLLGTFDIFCTEYCGTSHSGMIGKVKVVSDDDYNQWLATSGAGDAGASPEKLGEKLYKDKACVTCHSLDGSAAVGPTWKGIFGHDVKLDNNQTVKIDENYLRSSILEPNSQIVAGYQGVMPSYQGILDDKQVDAIIAYIKTLK